MNCLLWETSTSPDISGQFRSLNKLPPYPQALLLGIAKDEFVTVEGLPPGHGCQWLLKLEPASQPVRSPEPLLCVAATVPVGLSSCVRSPPCFVCRSPCHT